MAPLDRLAWLGVSICLNQKNETHRIGLALRKKGAKHKTELHRSAYIYRDHMGLQQLTQPRAMNPFRYTCGNTNEFVCMCTVHCKHCTYVLYGLLHFVVPTLITRWWQRCLPSRGALVRSRARQYSDWVEAEQPEPEVYGKMKKLQNETQYIHSETERGHGELPIVSC